MPLLAPPQCHLKWVVSPQKPIYLIRKDGLLKLHMQNLKMVKARLALDLEEERQRKMVKKLGLFTRDLSLQPLKK